MCRPLLHLWTCFFACVHKETRTGDAFSLPAQVSYVGAGDLSCSCLGRPSMELGARGR